MEINENGKLVEGTISDNAQELYDLKVFFCQNPVNGFQQLIDLADLNKDSPEFQKPIKDKFNEALGFNKYDEEVVKNLFDPTRQILYKYYLENFKDV